MAEPSELTLAERELASARISFNINRNALQATIEKFGGRDLAQDHLISAAEEFGVEHAMTELLRDPESFKVSRTLREGELLSIRAALTKAHDANNRVDLAMAKRETLLTKQNPRHERAFIFTGREAVFNQARNVLSFRDTGKEEAVPVEYVQTEGAGMKDDQQQDRDR